MAKAPDRVGGFDAVASGSSGASTELGPRRRRRAAPRAGGPPRTPRSTCSSDAGLELLRVSEAPEAVAIIDAGRAQVVLADAQQGPVLIEAARALPEHRRRARRRLRRPRLAGRAARGARRGRRRRDARSRSSPRCSPLRVATGLRAARLRASESMLRSLVDSIPGAIYRCACDHDWTMEWLSDEIETDRRLPGERLHRQRRAHVREHRAPRRPRLRRRARHGVRRHRAAVRARVPASSTATARSAGCSSAASRSRRATAAGGSTARSSTSPPAARPSGRRASTSSPRCSSPRCAPRAHGSSKRPTARAATSSATSTTAPSSASSPSRSACGSGSRATSDLPETCREPVLEALGELSTGLGELRDLARGLHPAVLSDHGLARALQAVTQRAGVPVELTMELPQERLPMGVEAAAYFVVSEALTNVARYAEASHAWVSVDAARRPRRGRDPRRRRRRRRARRRLGPAGPARPRRRAQRDARDRQPARRGHAAAARLPVR